MKASHIREMSAEMLQQKMRELSEESFKLRFQNATSQLDNTAMIRKIKKDIARVKTIIGERSANKGEV